LPFFRVDAVPPLLGTIVLTLALTTGGQAQSSPDIPSPKGYEQALLVTSARDSLRGSVEWPSPYRTPEVVRFWKPTVDSVYVFEPTAVRAAYLDDGRRLVRRTTQADQVPHDPKEAAAFLSSGKKRIAQEVLLLEVLVDGPFPLFVRHERRSRYFIEVEGEATELIKRAYYVEARNVVNVVRAYRDQLSRAMASCRDVTIAAEEAELELAELRALVVRYNRCVGASPGFVQREAPPAVEVAYGVVGGVTRGHLALKFPNSSKRSFGWGNGGVLGGTMTIQFPSLPRRVGIHVEMVGSVQRIAARPQTLRYGTTLSGSDAIWLKWMELNLLGRHRIWGGSYVEGGVAAGYRLGFEPAFPPGPDERILRHTLEESDRFTLGALAGIGYQFENVRVATHGGFMAMRENYNEVGARLGTLRVSVGYVFRS